MRRLAKRKLWNWMGMLMGGFLIVVTSGADGASSWRKSILPEEIREV